MIELLEINFDLNLNIDTIFGNNINDDINQIQHNLEEISNKIDSILENQRVIIKKLDKLPIVVYEQNIITNLDEKYLRIKDSFNLYYHGDILSENTIEQLYLDYSYILTYENRFSRIFNFITISQFLIYIKPSYKEFILIKLTECSKKFYSLEFDESQYCDRKLNDFKILLSNSQVKSHNFTEPFNVSNIIWIMKFNCQKTAQYSEYIGTSPSHGQGEYRIEGYPIYRNIEKLDDTWNNSCNSINNNLQLKLEKLKNIIPTFQFIKLSNKIVFVDYLRYLRR